jgi:hypothetical protein
MPVRSEPLVRADCAPSRFSAIMIFVWVVIAIISWPILACGILPLLPGLAVVFFIAYAIFWSGFGEIGPSTAPDPFHRFGQ